MPYIKCDKRPQYDSEIEELQRCLKEVPREKRKGDCNYIFSRVAAGVFPHDYHGISDMISALRDAADEIKRRLLGPREDVAISKNGDLPEFQ